jgi:hypothetical protein
MRASANFVHRPLQVTRTAREIRGSLEERPQPMRPTGFSQGTDSTLLSFPGEWWCPNPNSGAHPRPGEEAAIRALANTKGDLGAAEVF